MRRDEKIAQLVYVSQNTISGPTHELRREINAILEVAQKRNAELGITGLLSFNNGYFAQILEGDPNAIEELFEEIQMDSRHADVVVLEFKIVPERLFDNWSMGYVGSGQGVDVLFADMRLGEQPIASNDTAAEIVGVMRDVLHRNEVSMRAA